MILPIVSRALIVLFILVSPFLGPVNAQTATPTNSPTSTPTHTPTPTTANNAPYCASLTSDITTATGAPQTVTFTCAGVDPSGDITGAEFVFGDGTKELVQKNVGSPGSISVTHTYTTIGTLGVSCRVRDNDQVFSATTDACKRIITIRPKPSGATTTPTATTSSTPTLTITTTAPTAQPTINVQPTFYPEDDETTLVAGDTSSNRLWWILGAVVSLILGFLLLRRRKTHVLPPHTPPVGGPPPVPPVEPPIETIQSNTPPPPPPVNP